MLTLPTGKTPTGTTRVAAVIGSPVSHSLSPAIHNAAFQHLNLDWVYGAFEVPARVDGRPGGEAAVAAMRTLGLGGMSVTMPHKQSVVPALDHASPAVTALQACNCIYWDDDQLKGDNTDGDGWVASLQADASIEISGRTIAVLGTGGAARSIIEAAGRAGAAVIHVIGRSPDRAHSAAELASQAVVSPVEACADATVITNATPVGMKAGSNPHTIPLPAELINETHVVHDSVYDPRVTPLLAAARDRGATVVGGTGMLVHQAAAAFAHWTGHMAPIDVMTSASQVGERQ